jgi:membrane protein
MPKSRLRDVAGQAYGGWDRDNGILIAGGLAFFTALSLAPLIVVALSIVQIVLGRAATAGTLFERMAPVVGVPAATAIQNTVLHTMPTGPPGVPLAIGVIAAVIGAGGLILQVRASLDIVYGPPGKPAGLRGMLADVLRASMAVFVLGVYLVAVGAVWAAGSALSARMGSQVEATVEALITILMLFALLAFAYRYLAAAGQPWDAALAGSAVATLVMSASTIGFTVYLALGLAASAYGAAASFFVFLLWLFFMGIGFVVGAEVADAWQELRSGAGSVRR